MQPDIGLTLLGETTNMEYIKILFTFGLNCEAYQEISNGVVQRYCDLQGNTIDVPSVTESRVIEANPEYPAWGQ